MKINEIVNESLEEASLKQKLGAAALSLGALAGGHHDDASAQSYNEPSSQMMSAEQGIEGSPPAELIDSRLSQLQDPQVIYQSAPPQYALASMPPIYIGWPWPIWYGNRWVYPPRMRRFMQWQPHWQMNYWRASPYQHRHVQQRRSDYRPDYRPSHPSGFRPAPDRHPNGFRPSPPPRPHPDQRPSGNRPGANGAGRPAQQSHARHR